MKKALLICNTVLYAILYHISLFNVGLRFGVSYEYCKLIHDGNWYQLEYLWQYFYYPAAFFFLFFAGLSFVRNRENYSTKAFAIFGFVQFVPFAGYWILSQSHYNTNDPIFKLILFICTSVIFANYLISAFLTYKENRALKYRTYDTPK